MPQALIFAIGSSLAAYSAVATIGVFIMANAAIIATAAVLIGGMAYSSSKARQAKEDARNAYNAAQVDRLVNVTSAIAPRELVMGRVRKGGTIAYKASTGAYQKDLYLVVALAAHEIDAIEQIYLNDVPVTLDVNGNVLEAPYVVSTTTSATASTGAGYTITLPANYVVGSVSATAMQWVQGNEIANYEVAPTPVTIVGLTATTTVANATVNYQVNDAISNVKITKYLGAPGQVADAELVAAFGVEWTSANVGDGISHIKAKLTYSESSFPSGVPNITAVIRGSKLYDPRIGLTVWTENPALMMRHVYTHAKFGKSSVTAAEDARIITAANACDTDAVYTVGGVPTWVLHLYRASLVLPFGTAAKSGFDDLSQAMGGSWAFAGGELYVKAGVYTAPVMNLGDADLAVIQRDGASETQRPISISVHKERAQKFNTVKAKIWDQAQDYKQVGLTPLIGTTLLTRDGVELVQEVTYPAIGYAPQALHVAGIMMRDARDPLVVDLPFKLSAYRIELLETVSLTLIRYGWSAKTFMVLSRTWNMDGSLQLTLKETSAAITQMDAGFSAQGFASNTNLPSPWIVEAIGTLSISSGTAELVIQRDGTVKSRMRVSWPQVTDISVLQAGQIEVQYRLATSDGAWASLVVPGNETQVVTSDAEDGAVYIIRARAKTKIAVGDWNVQVQHQVIGKTEPPSNVEGFTIDGTRLMWEPVTDIDLAGYAIRYQYGSNIEWGTANPIHVGLITDMPYLMKSVPPGTVTILIKAVDTTGNESLSPAYIITNLGDSLVANVLESIDFKSLAWPGAYRNATLSVGNLQATQSDPFYSTNLSDFYDLDGTVFFTGNYDAMEWISSGWTPSLAAAGSNMTASWTLTGDSVAVQYRPTGPNPFYKADMALFYDPASPVVTMDFGLVSGAAIDSLDLGSITTTAALTYNFGSIN